MSAIGLCTAPRTAFLHTSVLEATASEDTPLASGSRFVIEQLPPTMAMPRPEYPATLVFRLAITLQTGTLPVGGKLTTQ